MTGRLDLPEACACCDGEAGVYRIESAQTLSIHVPYCRICRGHQRRPPWRALVWFLGLAGLVALGWTLHPVAPDSWGRGAGLVLLLLVASRALSYVLVPRFAYRRGHAREGRSLWIRGFTRQGVALAVCQEAYLARLGTSDPRPIRQPGRRISMLLFGATSVLQPLAVLGLAAGLLFVARPVPPDEQAYRAFRAAPSLQGATSIAQRFPASPRIQELEAYAWKEVVAARQKTAYQGYLRAFPRGAHRAEAQAGVVDLAFEELERTPERGAALRFLREFPLSPRASEARELLLVALEAGAVASPLSPPLPVLREIYQAASKGKLKVRIDGFKDEDYRVTVQQRIQAALRDLGLEAQWVKEDAVIDVAGEDGLDTSFSYSKFAFTGGGAPYGEYARAVASVRLAAGPAVWTGRVQVKSPPSVSYTTYRIGGSAPLDHGPSQYDVHSQTIPLFEKALKPLLEYR